ncbi:hypothetical protein E8E13_005199 [Curvularia kusanoi]|uniref:Uncharacterized protein n=1 Tax=Curvularia kusanoi TaxID=90978 RepID=A0A9P4TFD3_CURKU|nr:hypothetical protein E8E13_005199 [Curvularia kusanoi]
MARTTAQASRRSARILRSREVAESSRKAGYPCNCDNDGVCVLNRCTEPLAWNLDPSSVAAQTACPLFTVLPKEIRELIYEFALTETPRHPEEIYQTRRLQQIAAHPDRAENLLLTCKSVYLETYLHPILMNAFVVPCLHGISIPKPKFRLPWQFANVQALDITLQQTMLEGECLHDFLHGADLWQPEARHKGVYVAPYVKLRNGAGQSEKSFDFTLLPASKETASVSALGVVMEQMQLPPGFNIPQSSMRVQRARPLVQLTLRMNHTDWWTWTDHPDSTNAKHNHLGLDPALGDGLDSTSHRPTSTRMQELAQQRRDGYDPVPRDLLGGTTPGWAHVVAKLPDLKTLELVLETFLEKKAQLETVVECAKTWRFPIAGERFELAWSGEVEASRRSKINEHLSFEQTWGTTWYAHSTEFEVRTIRFKRRRRVHDSEDEDCKVH